jgi:hypothetical protein
MVASEMLLTGSVPGPVARRPVGQRADPRRCLQAIHHRQLPAHEDQIVSAAAETLDCRKSILSDIDPAGQPYKHSLDRFGAHLLVLYNRTRIVSITINLINASSGPPLSHRTVTVHRMASSEISWPLLDFPRHGVGRF